ncbi:C-type lectin domain family 2 member D-like isoform X2 [Chroicocephalus ridibundus]|uniref:C-type lectin domain family 2 member D-like isoform X2 n=1 Tax=Chroicocephalus ridibundus TaxID=1192867 RepID=UPI002FDC97E5
MEVKTSLRIYSMSAMGEGNRSCSSEGNVEEPLSPQDRGKSPHAEMPRGTDERPRRGLVGRCPTLHPVWVVVLAVLVALVLALAVAVAALSGRHGGDPAVPAALVLACPEDWVGYRNVCYYLSRAEGSWEWSQEQCSSHGASLAMPRREWEMEFLLRLKGNMDYWLGLRRRGERLQWVDGSSFNQRIPVKGHEPCLFLNDHDLMSASCSQVRPYLCSKPQDLMGTT